MKPWQVARYIGINVSRPVTAESRIKRAFGIEVYKCPKCGDKMIFKNIIYYKCGSLLEKIYENMYNKLDRD